MIFTKRRALSAILLCVGLTGCTPANFIQRVQAPPPCDVRVCLNVGASPARCSCQTHQQVQRQIVQAMGRQLQ